MDSLMDFLRLILPTGILSSLITWIISRRKQNNDMLSQLQASINMLSAENRKILDENIKLRSENAGYRVNQEETNAYTALAKEIERLRQSLTNKQIKNEKQNKMVDAADSVTRNIKLRHAQADKSEPIPPSGETSDIGRIGRTARFAHSDDAALSSGTQSDPDDGAGDDTILRSEGGDPDSEPP